MNSIDEQFDIITNSDTRGEISGQSARNINLISEHSSIKINPNNKDSITSRNLNGEKTIREERLDYSQHCNEPSEKSIQVNFEELTEINKEGINHKEEDINISEDP